MAERMKEYDKKLTKRCKARNVAHNNRKYIDIGIHHMDSTCPDQRENKRNIAKINNLFLGMADILALLLIFLPLYPKTVDGNLYSVNLIQYSGKSQFVLIMYWVLFSLLVVIGGLRIIVLLADIENCQKIITIVSTEVNVLALIFLMMAREPYAAVLAFALLAIKTITIYLCNGRRIEGFPCNCHQ